MAETGDLRALQIGSETFYPTYLADGIPFHFNQAQNQFLLAHQKTKSVEIAAKMVGKDLDWAQKFLASAKFRKFVYSTMQAASVRNGLTVEWWYQFGKMLADGYTEHYSYQCEFCQFKCQVNSYEAETYRDDDLQIRMACHSCFKPIVLEYQREAFKPTREQVEGWKELGSRLIPKIERVHHQFSKEEFVFEEETKE